MIPDNISKQHILKALEVIDEEGIPKSDHENSTEDLVKEVAECVCDCHKETHLF
jgi:hypothetical protein